MKIAFLVGKFPVLSQAFILNQMSGLIDQGHELDIYALEGRSHEDQVHATVKKYGLLKRTYYAPQLPVNYLWRWLKGLKLFITCYRQNASVCWHSLNVARYGSKAASLRLLYSTVPCLHSKSYDIIHCQFGTYALIGLLLRDLGVLRGKLIVTFRGYDISEYPQQHGRHIYDRLFQVGDFFLANCEFFRQRAIALGCDEQKIVVHGSGIDCNKFTFSPRRLSPNETIQIVTIGRLVEKKGIEYGIRAIAKLAKVHPNLEYQIIGDGDLREDLEQLINKLKVNTVVKLLGWKQQQEIISILERSHILLAPCVTAKNGDCDAPVNTLKEAMAMGLPVVSTQHGGIPELVEEGVSGFLVPERDAEAIAQKLSYLIEHPEIWSRMGRAGRICVEENYNTNKLNTQLVEIYQRLLSTEFSQPRGIVTEGTSK